MNRIRESASLARDSSGIRCHKYAIALQLILAATDSRIPFFLLGAIETRYTSSLYEADC